MTSLQIAEITGKTHSNVMRDIRNILEQLEEKHKFNFELMFKITKLGNNAERKDPYYLLTKKDCLLLASGYDANLRAKAGTSFCSPTLSEPAQKVNPL